MKRIYILLFSLALASCGKSEKNTETAIEQVTSNNTITITQSQFESEKMELGTLSEQSFNETIKTNGFIDVPPQNRASVSTFLGGYVKRTPLLIGDKVKKGQLVVILENTEFVEVQQEYLEVTEQLNYLKTEFERQQTLYNEKITSQKNFLKAESTYKSSLAQYNGLRKKLKMMNINPTSVEQGNISSTINIYTPIQGYVTKVNVSNGTYVSPSETIIEIVNTDHIHLELTVFEKDILKIKKGQVIHFKIPEASNKVYKAEVHLVGTSVNEKDRTVKVHGHLEDDEKTNFVTGMFAEAEIISSTKKTLALPKEAITEVDGDYFVLVLKNKNEGVYTFDTLKLEVGKQSEEFVEVTNISDLKGKEILTKGGFMLLN
ncbi:cobalt-zinc-cadmium efflux system membrane fusion protein [Tenacibaculum adriaticum]|uniref:Cobalt-zinc-cadmium efflux system membrane fusion protein n=1 Tax=Tenacibaculum adriaticum TaxID=413713 RepID=A0A5S5DYG8_9FLAO|nr:efflux RND transporter periplasmic adaptor subunit [Tenacibaculum adriaticum]TYQ00077.1 cobalt-zinc-cadmium efflux system membrane fusion protein [Tenacibaculum adriaticum]